MAKKHLKSILLPETCQFHSWIDRYRRRTLNRLLLLPVIVILIVFSVFLS